MKQLSFCLCLLLCIYLLKAGRPVGSPKTGFAALNNNKESRMQKGSPGKRAYRRALPACPYTTLYVDSSIRRTTGDGGSWLNAYRELSAALEAAAQCSQINTILVAKGTYNPTGDNNRDSAFTVLRGGLKLYGGYASGGNSRDIVANPTVLSGDINHQNDTSDNSYHVMVIAGLGSSADSVVVDGFTFIKGNASGGSTEKSYNGSGLPRNAGGGLAIRASDGAAGKIALRGCTFLYNNAAENGGGLFSYPGLPTVKSCIFSYNSSKYGGGMYNYQSSPALSDCIFSFNTAGQLGGGLFNNQSSSPAMTGCTLNANTAVYGAGMYNAASSSPSITNCIFSGNSVTTSGGGIYNASSSAPAVTNSSFTANAAISQGGGMFNESSSPTVTSCTFNANKAVEFNYGGSGGGMYNRASSPVVTNCTFSANTTIVGGGGMFNESSSPTITECIFSANTSFNEAGGMENYSSSSTITHCIFVANTSRSSGGCMLNYNSSPTIANCIFSANKVPNGVGGSMFNSLSSPAITKCIFTANKAYSGGGVYNQASSSPLIADCVFYADSAVNGGGICNSGTSPVIANCTFNANIATNAGGGMINVSASPFIANCIIWDNSNDGISNTSNSSKPTVSYSDVQGSGVYPGKGNINADPRFVNPADPDGADNLFGTADDGLKLRPASPVINKGNNDSIPAGITTDITGAARIQQGTIDMGAYESPYPTPLYLSINDVSKAEGNSGITPFTFTVRLSGAAAAGGASFTITTADSSAIAPIDYAARTFTANIPAGDSTYSFDVSVNGDSVFEATEYFLVKVTGVSGTGVFVSDSVGVGTITNDEACPSSATLYVDSSRSTSGSGSSWATAYKELSDALTAAYQCTNINTILVAKGTYKPTANNRRDSAFAILRGSLRLFGGYPSGGGTRDVVNNPTILSGDIGNQNDSTDNSYHVMVLAGLEGNNVDSLVVDGFTITKGNANDGSSRQYYLDPNNSVSFTNKNGGGLFLFGFGVSTEAGNKTALRNCTFSANTATNSGGGMYNAFSFPAIINCTFSGNMATSGGGLFNNSASPLITNCTFSGNMATSGGGVYNLNSSYPKIANCIIWGNSSGIVNNSGTPVVSYSDVQGTGVYSGTGNINADPLFTNPSDPDGPDNRFATADDGLKLQQGSPAINKGNNAAVPAGVTTDITGAARIQQGIVDMGAYESPFAPVISLSIDDVSKAEGNTGTTPFTFTVRLSAAAPAGGASFTITTVDGTAANPSDYTTKTLTANIPAGDSTYTFTVLVNGDTNVEPDEFFSVFLSNATGTGVVIADAQGIGTILNDDTDPCATDSIPPVITPKNITVYLNASGQATIQPFDVIQSVTDNCQLDSASIRISQSTFSCSDVGDSTTTIISHLAYAASTSIGNQAYGGELGMEFSVNRRITINQLGAFDHQSNGITGAVNGGIRVAVFNKATQQIVPGLDALVSGLADGFASNHRLKNIASVQLLPGNYVIVAKGYNANELNGNSGLGSPIILGDNANGAISYTGSGLYGTEGSGFSYPQNPDGGPANRYLAGTFAFSVDSTTPPATAHQAYTASTSTGVQAYGGELGMAFQVNTSSGITISRLGAFDHQGNGITGTQNGGIRVAIFNQATQTIVPGLDTIIKGQGNAYSGNHRFINITPVSLPAGNYLVVAKGYNAGELNGNAGFGTPPAGTDNAGGAIAYTGGGFYGSEGAGFSYPQNTDGGPATRYLAGSFIYSVNNTNSIAAAAAPLAGSRLEGSRVATLVSNLSAAAAGSPHQAYTASTSTGVQNYGGELGMEFRVNNPNGIVISQLGAFDHQGNGIQGSIRVAIFNKASRSIVAGLDATVSGQADAYASNHRLKNITPVTLLPGDYVVVAKGYNASELNGNAGFGTPPAGTDNAGGAISYMGGGLYGNEGAGFSYPLNSDGGPATRYLAGTFVYQVVESAGSKTVMITASDKKGNTTMATAQVTVKDTLGACRGTAAAAMQQASAAVDVEPGSVIRLYPNPARDRFTVQLSGMRGTKGKIEVMDINGRVLEQRVVSFGAKASTQSQVFSLSAQPSGVYFVRVRSDEGMRTLKVIVAR